MEYGRGAETADWLRYQGETEGNHSVVDHSHNFTVFSPYLTDSANVTARPRPPFIQPLLMRGEVRIPLYSMIFLLSVVGNTLVIVTLAQNKRMRTVTNVFLLNLSISDLLLAVFCMPFTLIPTLLQNFIFGKTMCVMIRYLQGKCHVRALRTIQSDLVYPNSLVPIK